MRQKKKGDQLGFVENATLGESDEPVDRVTIYRDTDLGKGEMQDPTPGKEPWTEPRTLVLVTTDVLGSGQLGSSAALRACGEGELSLADAARGTAVPGSAGRGAARGYGK